MARKKKSMKLGGGGRFAKLKAKIKAKEGYSDAGAAAAAAAIGREKYGAHKMGEMAGHGRHLAAELAKGR